jgi:hypothetical protein
MLLALGIPWGLHFATAGAHIGMQGGGIIGTQQGGGQLGVSQLRNRDTILPISLKGRETIPTIAESGLKPVPHDGSHDGGGHGGGQAGIQERGLGPAMAGTPSN